MKGKDIEPGTTYALRSWHERGEALRAVRAIRAEGQRVVYEGPGGAEWTGDMARIVGPWRPHADARDAAFDAVAQLQQTHGSRPAEHAIFESAEAIEHGYRDFRIHLTCAVHQTQRLAELISALKRPNNEDGPGAGTPEPPFGSS